MTEDAAHKLYAARLFECVNEATLLKSADVSIGDWSPVENECHGNVTSVCEHESTYTSARGWLYFDFGGSWDRVKFVAHSAIRAPDGTLYNITPSSASQQCPFILAEESEEDFAKLVEVDGIGDLWHFK